MSPLLLHAAQEGKEASALENLEKQPRCESHALSEGLSETIH